MTRSQTLAQLYRDTAHAHHEAFAATDGEDPEWPLWYAAQLKPHFDGLLFTPLTRSEIVALLVNVDREHRARAPERPWDQVYAELTVERHVGTDDERLSLYYLDYCLFCLRVTRIIDELQADVEIRDIWAEPDFRTQLVQARGRPTVPVLRCERPDGSVRWMPESATIIEYLQWRFGGARS